MVSFQPRCACLRRSLWRKMLLGSIALFLGTALFQNPACSLSLLGRAPEPLGPVLTVSTYLPALLNVASIKKAPGYFHSVQDLADDGMASRRYTAVLPTCCPGRSGILKPGHLQQALLHLDLPPPAHLS